MRDFRGFTLVEMLVVILVIATLSAIGISQYIHFDQDAKVAVTKDRLNRIRTAILGDSRVVSGGVYAQPGYSGHCGGLPVDLKDLVEMPGDGICASPYDPMTRQGWRGPYVSGTAAELAVDVWGTALDYQPGSKSLRSCGPNLICGDGDDIVVGF